MIGRIVIVAVGIVCLTVGSAHAFQESGAKKADGASPSVSVNPLDLSTDAKELSTEKGGSIVRIPGLGALGVLPKLDFGLELLYGDTQPETIEPREDNASESDGLRIKGTLKHRF